MNYSWMQSRSDRIALDLTLSDGSGKIGRYRNENSGTKQWRL